MQCHRISGSLEGLSSLKRVSLLDCLTLEEESTMFLQNDRNHDHSDTVITSKNTNPQTHHCEISLRL
jgi:hypothetical protein